MKSPELGHDVTRPLTVNNDHDQMFVHEKCPNKTIFLSYSVQSYDASCAWLIE